MEKLINALLNDDNGISEEAFNALVEHLEMLAESVDFDQGPEAIDIVVSEAKQAIRLRELLRQADATDGRFYFSS